MRRTRGNPHPFQRDRRPIYFCQGFGIGMSEEHQEKIFDKFYRIEETSKLSGLGIGLYICQEIIDRHQGKIGVKSTLAQVPNFTIHTTSSKKGFNQSIPT